MLEEKTTAAVSPVALRDEDGALREEFVDRAAQAITAGNAAALRALLGDLHPSDVGDLIQTLDAELRPRLASLMGHDFDFSALTEVDSTVRVDILEGLPAAMVADGVRELDTDDAVAILADLAREKQTEILEQLPSTERVALARSLLYPENSAGRRMQTEFMAVPPDWTVGQAIDYMRDAPDLPDRFYEIYAVDGGRHWQGAVSLDVLLRSRRPVPLADLIDEDRRRGSV